MSPEQLLGRTVDERSDLFSLSVILFEMATGRRPFQSGEPLDVLVESLKMLPRADRINPGVPKALADVIARGLATYPQDRFQSAAEMGLALDALATERPPLDGRHGASIASGSPLTVRHLRWGLGGVVSIPVALWCLGRVDVGRVQPDPRTYRIVRQRTGAGLSRVGIPIARRAVCPGGAGDRGPGDAVVRRAGCCHSRGPVARAFERRAQTVPRAGRRVEPRRSPRRGAGSGDRRGAGALPRLLAIQCADSGVGGYHQQRRSPNACCRSGLPTKTRRSSIERS